MSEILLHVCVNLATGLEQIPIATAMNPDASPESRRYSPIVIHCEMIFPRSCVADWGFWWSSEVEFRRVEGFELAGVAFVDDEATETKMW